MNFFIYFWETSINIIKIVWEFKIPFMIIIVLFFLCKNQIVKFYEELGKW